MSEVKSSSGAAQSIASSISASLSSLDQVATITKDTQTTVAGNSHAQQAITQLTAFNASLVQAVELASNNIRLVAAEFEAVDQEISQSAFQQCFVAHE
jgi:type VII secretion effector (TIGR04197 family)